MAPFHPRLRSPRLSIHGLSTAMVVSILALLAVTQHGSEGDIARSDESQSAAAPCSGYPDHPRCMREIKIALTAARDDDGWAGFPTRLEVPVTYAGNRIADYEWDYIPSALGRNWIWVAAKAGAARDPGGCVVLGWTSSAVDMWGARVRLQAVVSVTDLTESAYAALFVRVANEETGRTLVLDNMRSRPIQGVNQVIGRVYAVVVNVPYPPGGFGNSCPAEELVPDAIYAGLVMCGGRGRVDVVDAKFGVVQSSVPVTGGDPPFVGPPEMV